MEWTAHDDAGIAPSTGDDIRAALLHVHELSAAYWRELATAEFLAPMGSAWSPADHVRHLTKAMRAVRRGLDISRVLLALRFGLALRPSRSYAETVQHYRAGLPWRRGPNPFAPSQASPADPESWRTQVMQQHSSAVAELAESAARWSERALDRHRLPHPLLGMLTVREMLFFTIYHNHHHVRVVAERRAAAAFGA